MNVALLKRSEYISKVTLDVEKMEKDFEIVQNNILRIKNDALNQSDSIVKTARNDADGAIVAQLLMTKKMHGEIVDSARKNLNNEICSLESTFKNQIDLLAQSIFDGVFLKKH